MPKDLYIEPIRCDRNVVIVGAGAAGLMTALRLAPVPVTVLCAGAFDGDCASAWSQGGIAAAVSEGDSPLAHAADTMQAAAGTADAPVVAALTKDAPESIKKLAAYGVKFERGADGGYRLNREACHSARRVLKAEASDGFGRELMRALRIAARATPSIEIVEHVEAERLLKDAGGRIAAVQVFNKARSATQVLTGRAVVLATGGVGGLYAYTTNPLGATGRGVALAARAGAVVSDLEFVQFHPTALDIGEDPMPLATEALRGEGAVLVNGDGERFMAAAHKMAELAPRDVVSREIFKQIKQGQRVCLDCRNIDTGKFPALRVACARAGLDPARDLVPVMPAVHYYMGGVATNLAGRSSLDGLWACGEVTATGLHGANRLASNSLMEAVVMGERVARDIAAELPTLGKPGALEKPGALPRGGEPAVTVQVIRALMSDFVGVVRTGAELRHAIDRLTMIERRARATDFRVADMALLGRMIARLALQRTESRGGHCRADYPDTDDAWKRRSFTTLEQLDRTGKTERKRIKEEALA